MALTLNTQLCGDAVVFHCQGRIVFGDEAAVFRERVMSMITATAKIVVDLEGVDYIDARGLGVLVELFVSAKNRGGQIKLVSPRERVKDVLCCTKLNTVFRLYQRCDD